MNLNPTNVTQINKICFCALSIFFPNISWLVNRGGKTVARMPSSSAVASCNNGIEHSGQNIKDNEYARLVTPAEHATADKKFCVSNQS